MAKKKTTLGKLSAFLEEQNQQKDKSIGEHNSTPSDDKQTYLNQAPAGIATPTDKENTSAAAHSDMGGERLGRIAEELVRYMNETNQTWEEVQVKLQLEVSERKMKYKNLPHFLQDTSIRFLESLHQYNQYTQEWMKGWLGWMRN